MKRSRFGLAMLLLAATTSGQSTSSQPAPPSGTGSVAGRVSDAITGEPLSGATIRLLPMQSAGGQRSAVTAVSDADGGFHFENLGRGTYTLRGEHAGYLTTSRFEPGDSIRLGNGQFLSDVPLKLMPESRIGGRVYDDVGRPVAGSHLRALQRAIFSGRVELVERSSGDTNKDGQFSIGKLRPGKYLLIADPPRSSSAGPDTNPNGGLVTTLFPHALNVEEAEELEISAGNSSSDVKLYLRRAPAHHVRGKLGDGVGQYQQVDVLLSPTATGSSTALARRVQVSKNGTFDTDDVLAGSYVLRAVGGRRAKLLARAEVEVSADDVNNVVLAPLPAVVVSGTVSMEGAELPPVANRVHVFARPIVDDYASAVVAEAAADGTFQFPGLDSEEYLFGAVAGINGVYVEAVMCNGQDIRGKAMDVSQMSVVKLEVILRNGSGSISGTVQTPSDDSPAGISVVLVPKQVDAIGSNVQFAYTDRNGGFRVGNLRPDEYTLYAVHRADADVWQNAAFLSQIAPLGADVPLAENQQQQVQLKLTDYEQVAQAALRADLPAN